VNPEDLLGCYKLLVLGETPGAGSFYQTLWVASGSLGQAVDAAEASLAEAGDELLQLESWELVDAPVPASPAVRATGRAYFPE